MTNISCLNLLKDEFEKRKQKNPSYSMRAFARDLGVGKTTVFEVMNGTRKLSKKNIDSIGAKLHLSSEIIEKIKQDLEPFSFIEDEIIKEDDLCLIGDWYFVAILSLAKMPNAEFSPSWISERLNIPIDLAREALQSLEEKGMIENVNGAMIRRVPPLMVKQDISSTSIVEHHIQSLKLAESALREVENGLCDFTTVTCNFNPARINQVKEAILNFHRKLGRLIETKDSNEVYRLNIHFFPLTKISK